MLSSSGVATGLVAYPTQATPAKAPATTGAFYFFNQAQST